MLGSFGCGAELNRNERRRVLSFNALRLICCAVMFPMLKYREKHPTNLVLLGVFTLCCSLSIAMTTSTSLGTGS